MDRFLNRLRQPNPGDDGALAVTLQGESLMLLPERAVFWPSQSALLVADLHWGKDEAFRRQGSPVPPGVLTADLKRLKHCIDRWPVERVYILGDLIHNREGMSEDVVHEIVAWRETVPVEMILIPGNHDRHLAQLPLSFIIQVMPYALTVAGFEMTHDPTSRSPSSDDYMIGGHVHPLFRIRSSNDLIMLPCFYFGPDYALLPAFSEFTGGFVVNAERDADVYLTDGRVVLPAPRRGFGRE